MLEQFMKKYHLENKHYYLGVILILISGVTWTMDFTSMVDACAYCRTQRTMIGIIGILFLIDRPVLYVLIGGYCVLLGLDVSFAQVFLHIKSGTFPKIDTYLAISAAYILFISVIYGIYRIRARLNPPSE